MAHRSKLAQAAAETIVGCVLTCIENAKAVLALALVLTALSIGAAATFLSINTDTAKMIDQELPFRQRFAELLKAFPQLDESLIVVVEAEDPDTATATARAVVAAFAKLPELYSDIYAPEVDPYFERNGLLYLSESELQQVAGRLQAGLPLLVPLAQDPTLRGLSQFFQVIGYSAQQGADPADFNPFLNEVQRVFESAAGGTPAIMDWAGFLMPNPPEGGGTRKFISIKPVLDYSSLEPAEKALAEARRIIEQPGLADRDKVKIRLTGDIVINAEELRSVADGAVLASIISLVLVSLVLIFGVRSWRLVTAALLTLVIGLTWTAGVATLTVGYLNLISVAFAVMFVGLGIDFAIHFCLRYEEEIRRGLPMPIAFANTADGVGGALAVCTGAAAVGFLAFTPTSFAGMAQLGIISAAGMAIAFITSITVLPALLVLMPLPEPKRQAPARRRTGEHIGRLRRPAVFATLAVCVIGLFFLPQVRFDGDPINLKDPETDSVKTFLELFNEDSTSPYLAQVLVTDDAQARELSARLTELPEVSRVINIFSFLPSDQRRKLPLVRETRTAIGQVPLQPIGDIGEEARREALQTMVAILDELSQLPRETFSPVAARLRDTIGAFAKLSDGHPAAAAGIEQALFAGLAPTIEAMAVAFSASEVGITTLPASVRDRYISQDGHLRLEVFPTGNISDQVRMRAFSDAVLQVAPQATGSPVEVTGAADVVVEAMLQATAIAGLLIALVLLISLRRPIDVMLVLLPILLAGTLTLASTVWLGTPFNFANVIVLPLLIGLGVAGGVHLVVRSRISRADLGLFETNTPRAVLLSALTTIGSFASLATSSHRGMASMGVLLTISIVFTLICTLVVLPQLISWLTGKAADETVPNR